LRDAMSALGPAVYIASLEVIGGMSAWPNVERLST
jgi:hypothetical protein